MYYTLCLALCLAVMFLVITGTSMLCMACLRYLDLRRVSPSMRASILFMIRALPAVLAGIVAFGFALPAFLRFEPQSSGEFVGARLLALASMGAFLLVAMTVRAVRILRATMLLRKQWSARGEKLTVEGVNLPVYCVEGSGSLMAVIGIFRPRIFVARRFVQALSGEELSAALAHEMAHVRSFDNFKQFFLKITRPPHWLNIFRVTDAAWTNASEVAADENALTSGASALDLSSALVKAGRLGANSALCEAVAASHLLPTATQSSFEVRVAHLQRLLEENSGPRAAVNISAIERHRTTLLWMFLLLAYAASFNAVLPWIHEALEFLVQ
ncbi:MAG: M48 family metalloprotease [Acidobacteriia bacterium]|nr:M48 family metalloprotease [Terriglobia bacterium]